MPKGFLEVFELQVRNLEFRTQCLSPGRPRRTRRRASAIAPIWRKLRVYGPTPADAIKLRLPGLRR